MHDDRESAEARVQRALRERILPAVYGESVPLRVEVWPAPGEPVPAAAGLAAEYRPAAVGDPWGPAWSTTWFRVSGRVPTGWAGRTVEAVLDLGFDGRMPGFQCEGLVHGPGGAPIKGLNPRNAWVPVGAPVAGGEEVLFHVEAAANPVILDDADPFRPTPWGERPTSAAGPLYRLARMDLAVFDTEVWELAMDVEVLSQLMTELGVADARRWDVLRALDRALDVMDLHDVSGSAARGRAELAGVLDRPANASAHRISAVGHAHIDSAWLWPLRETVRKVARTTSNVTALMDDHPEFVFAMSQAQQLAWLKEHHPQVFAGVRAKVESGQFVPVGGMWVESDTNMPGGEAMARQFVHGKRFFRDEFGVETGEVWLPDSFGYSAALPQLVAQSGSRWFLTQKISWNRTNKFPHHTFWWEGIDGTRVFTHFPPVDTYNSELSGRELAHAARNFAEKGRARWSMVPFGWGDGGGGPTREMLARAKRLADLEGSPRVVVREPAEFFRTAEEEYPDAPVWVGELYLEIHRGTYTSQANTKRGNRRSEHLLREAELWSATATVRLGVEYPLEELDRLWKVVLLHQFHDILPGSSIAWVHREAEQAYARVAQELEAVIARAQRALAGDGPDEVVFNATPHARHGVPGGGAGPRSEAVDAPVTLVTHDGSAVLDNGLLRVTVDEHGLLTSVRDLVADREVIAPGLAGNLLQVHPDFPNQWDAWDVDSFYRNTVLDLTGADEVAVESAGPGEVVLRLVRAFSKSVVTQRVRLRAGARQVDIDTEVDWRESERFLKLAFPLDLLAERSTAETQFGHVHRAAHANTGWDAAKFEVCAHRWIHVGEPDYGVALVNDATYGHDVTRAARDGGGITTTLRASLLRAPRFPDPGTDHGVHHFRHALVVGAHVSDAIREGYRINLPERSVRGGAAVAPLVEVDNPAVVVEAVKLADDGSGDVVVRLYEAHGCRATAGITAGFGFDAVESTDLLERSWDAGVRYAPEDNGITVELRPFRILTLRFTRHDHRS